MVKCFLKSYIINSILELTFSVITWFSPFDTTLRFLKTLLKSSFLELVGLFVLIKLNPVLVEDSNLLLFKLVTFVLLSFVRVYNNSELDLLFRFECSSTTPVDFPLMKLKPFVFPLTV
jgi:hypothetical protein